MARQRFFALWRYDSDPAECLWGIDMNSIFKTYLVTGVIVCLLFGTAALSGWRLPKYDTGSSSSRTSSSSRSGGSSFFGGFLRDPGACAANFLRGDPGLALFINKKNYV